MYGIFPKLFSGNLGRLPFLVKLEMCKSSMWCKSGNEKVRKCILILFGVYIAHTF